METNANILPVFESTLSSSHMVSLQQPYDIHTVDVSVQCPMPVHWHDAFEMGYVLDGEGIFEIEGQSYPFRQGQVHIINNSLRHMAYASDTARFFNVHFHPDLLCDFSFPGLERRAFVPFAGNAHFVPLLPSQSPHTQEIIDTLQAIAVESANREVGWELMVKGQIMRIVAYLLRHFVASNPDRKSIERQRILTRLAPAIRLIEQKLSDPPSIDELAGEVALGRSQFQNLFRKALAVSPVTYRNMRRIALAKIQLCESDQPITTIASGCGFSTPHQFSLLFRRYVGCSPHDYRHIADSDR